ncbi:MAG: regulatory signaling modulator protein AmpE [Pseudomonadales bacterium]|nr:regulatory signaling modulator protein AmpE [Pseudomonadales bacterium]
MKFLTIIIVVMILKLADFRGLVHRDSWYHSFRKRWLAPDETSDQRQLLFGLLLPASVVAALISLFEGWMFGLVGLALNIFVLLYCFGREDLSVQISDYLNKVRNKDTEGAYRFALETGLVSDEHTVDDESSLTKKMLSGLMYQEFQRFFLVLFWYLVLGAFGALFICFGMLIRQVDTKIDTKENNNFSLVTRFIAAAQWIPVRILAFTFGLIGNFEKVYQSYKKSISEYDFGDETLPAQGVLSECGFAAMGFAVDDAQSGSVPDGEPNMPDNTYIQLVEQVEETQRLLHRSLIIWLAGLSVLMLVGWFS